VPILKDSLKPFTVSGLSCQSVLVEMLGIFSIICTLKLDRYVS
jgi:hypothetical protein